MTIVYSLYIHLCSVTVHMFCHCAYVLAL